MGTITKDFLKSDTRGASIMARGGFDHEIELKCWEPNLADYESYENLTDKQLMERLEDGRSYRSINIKSPINLIRQRSPHFRYFFNQMEIEKHATPMGLGMADGDTIVLWDSFSLNSRTISLPE